MSKDNTNKQNDTDILRAQDIVPPYNKEFHQEQDLQETETNRRDDVSSQSERRQSLKDTNSQFVGEKAKHAGDLPAEPADPVQQTGEIPKFNLAEQIMAEQRKITAIRRKAPSKRAEPPGRVHEVECGPILQEGRKMAAQSIGYAVKQPLMLSEQEQIIAEIVARDIEKLCRGGTLSLRRQDFRDTNIHAQQNTPPRS